MTSCAITGPRPSRFQFRYNENDQRCMTLKEQIRAELIRLCEQGVHVYYIGGALGVDMWCAEILLELQGKQYPGTHIITAIPFEGYDQEWKPEYKVRMALIRKHTENVVVCAEPSSDSYRKRNFYMVDHADCLLAVYDINHPISRSGTAMTIRYAQKKKFPTIFVQP